MEKFKDGDMVMVKRGGTDNYKYGIFLVVDNLPYFVEDGGMTYAVDSGDTIIAEPKKSVKVDVPIRYVNLPKSGGISVADWIKLAMQEKYARDLRK